MLQVGQMGVWSVSASVNVTVKRRRCIVDGIQHRENHRQHTYHLLSRRQHPHTRPYRSSSVLSPTEEMTVAHVTVQITTHTHTDTDSRCWISVMSQQRENEFPPGHPTADFYISAVWAGRSDQNVPKLDGTKIEKL